MENGRLGVTGDLVAKRVEEELDPEAEAAIPHHHQDQVEIALALEPKQVVAIQMLVA